MKRLDIRVLDGVYPPEDDSYMLAEAVRQEGVRGKKFLEVGCGTGIVSIVAALEGAQVTAVDVNPAAVENTKLNAERNAVRLRAYVSDLFENVSGTYDVIAFNPPYLPSDRSDPAYDLAWSGGRDGREILDRFLEALDGYLNPCGVVLLVQSSLNAPEKTLEAFQRMGYDVGIVSRKRFFMETLYVFRAVKPCP